MCERRGVTRFVGFLDEREAALADRFLKQQHSATVGHFFGGHEEAERVMLGVFPDAEAVDEAWFPLTAVAFRFRKEATVTHRDVLGSIIGCGVVREKIGDIVCGEGLAVAFLHEDIAAFVAESVDSIGREGVKTEAPFMGELPVFRRYRPISGTVASPRLDAVLKVLLGLSREQAAGLVEASLVQVNHTTVTSVSKSLCEGDIVSVRGYGRYVIDDVSALSKKGRVILSARQYV